MKSPLPLLLSLICLGSIAFADSGSDSFKLNEAVLTQWKQNVQERPVQKIMIHLKRESGDNNTFVNLRFGGGSVTLDGAKRVYLTDNKWRKYTWNCNGVMPKNKPLILNAYNGSVRVDYVQVVWQ
jgi:hypothetical protein